VQLVVVLVVVTFFVAVLLEFLPGDPVKTIAPSPNRNSATRSPRARTQQPLPERYVEWLGGFVHGDLGNYYRGPQVIDPVSDDAWGGLGVSLQLMIYTQILTLLVAIPLGILTAQTVGHLRQGDELRRVAHLDPELRACSCSRTGWASGSIGSR
jgi:peptide/nickel transport system permease protein